VRDRQRAASGGSLPDEPFRRPEPIDCFASLTVDPVVHDTRNGNGVLEMNENAILDPGWSNDGATDFTSAGTVSESRTARRAFFRL
jgi:hypothetical protein